MRKATAEDDDLVPESSSSGTNTGPPQNFNIERMDLRDAFVDQEKAEKERQTEELTRLKDQVAMLSRLFGKESQPTPSAVQKKAFTGIKVYGKDPQLYYGHDHFKYDSYVYQMEKVFKSNEALEEARNPEEHKVAFSTSWLVGNAAQIWRTKERMEREAKQ